METSSTASAVPIRGPPAGEESWHACARGAPPPCCSCRACRPREPAENGPPFLGRFVFRTYAQGGRARRTCRSNACCRTGSGSSGPEPTTASFASTAVGSRKFSREAGPAAHPDLSRLHETADGRLYVAHRAGLARYQGQRFVVLGEKAGPRLFAVSHQGLAVRRRRHALRRHRSRALRRAGTTASSSTRRPTRSARARSAASTWTPRARSTSPAAVALSQGVGPRRRVRATARPARPTRTSTTSRPTRAGRLWVRTVKHLFLLRHGAPALRARRRRAAGVERGRSPRLRRSRRAAGADGAGTRLRASGAAWRLIGRREGLASIRRSSALVDREGSLWIGLLGGGLTRRLGPRPVHELVARPTDFRTRSSGPSRARRRRRAPGAIWVGTEQGLNRIDPETGAIRVYRECRRPRGQHRQRARGRRGRQHLGRLVAGRSDAVSRPTGGCGAIAAEDAAPDQFRVAAIHERADGEVWVGAVSGLYRLAGWRRPARARRDRPGKAGRRPRLRRGSRRDPLCREQAGDPPGHRPLTSPVHAPATDCARISSPRSPLRRRQPGRRLSRVDRRREGDLPGRPAHGPADRRLDRSRVEQGRSRRARRAGIRVDRNRLGRRCVRRQLDARGALRQARRHDQRGPRSECVLRRAGRHGVARLEPRPDPLPAGHRRRRREPPPNVVITSVQAGSGRSTCDAAAVSRRAATATSACPGRA